MKALQLLIESQLPERLRDPNRRYTAKDVGNLLSDMAVHYPDEYDRISRLLADTGRHASYWQGETIGLSDLKPVMDKGPVFEAMRAELEQLDRNAPDYGARREQIWHTHNNALEKLTADGGQAQHNNIALSVLSGARGKNSQLKMMLTTPGLYADPKGRTIPLFIQNSFGEGLRPAEYLAGTFGARSTVISTKSNTAKGGDLGKQGLAVSIPQIVTDKDCGTDNGVDLDLSDKSVRGRVLARAAGGLPAGTVLDRATLKKLEQEKVTKIVARSALTCQAGTGLCQHCVGKFHDNRFPELGQSVGATAAQAIFEPVTQMALSCLAEGTLVRMADLSTKPIEALEPGDMVLGADVTAHTFPIPVTHKWDQGLQPVKSRSWSGAELRATDCHVILTGSGPYVKAQAGTSPQTIPMWVGQGVGSVELDPEVRELGLMQCWDISVDHPDELFVLANGLIVKNSKHTGGAAGTKKDFSGFKYINQLVQSPEEFPDRAVVSETAGTVSSIEEAPQGGYFVQVGDQRHYVRHGYPLQVKVGDQVEAGDQLAEGLIDVSDIVRLRGLGSGRRYLADRLHTMLEDSGVGNDRRNVEIVSRAAIDHIRVQDDSQLPGTLPDDQLSYNRTAPDYVPPASARQLPTDGAVGKYLQAPALHYTIGQKLTPKQVKKIQGAGYDRVLVADDEPAFTPEMQRLRTATQTNPDWLARMHGSYLQSNLERAAVRGQDTNYKHNPNYVPRLAYGKDFGKDVRTTGEF